MSKEEAIEWLISMYNTANQINNCMEYKEALNIAIQTIETRIIEEKKYLGK